VDAYLIDAVRTPFGRHRGGLAGTRTDDLAAACVGVGQGTAMVVRVD
jgi:acetyl-CoA acetyltransferase